MQKPPERPLTGRLYETIMFSSVWLRLWKLWKFVLRHFVYQGTHEIYRLCLLDRSQMPISSGPAALVFPMADRFPVIRRLMAWSSQSTGTFNEKLVYRLDRSLMYSSKLSIARRQLESHDTIDLTPSYRSIIGHKFPIDYSIGEGEEDREPLAPVKSPHSVLYRSLVVIHSIHLFVHRLNQKAAMKYDSTQKQCESKLMAIHLNLLQKNPTQRISKEWQLLGFQGSDPATDFRAMGQLALEQLLHASKQKAGRQTWAESGSGVYGYSWAISGIQLTAFQLQLLRARKLNHLLYDWYFQTNHKTSDDIGRSSSSASTEDEEDAFISGIASGLTSLQDETTQVMNRMTERYYDMYVWMFVEYHQRWTEFCAKKESEHHQESLAAAASSASKPLQPFVPVLMHNEFFNLFKDQIENQIFDPKRISIPHS